MQNKGAKPAMKRMIPLLLTGLLSSGLAHAADLLSVYRDASDHDTQYAIARSSRDAGIEKLPQGLAGLLPMVNLQASSTWNDVDFHLRSATGMDTQAKYNTNNWNVTLTQPLFRWQNWSAYQQAELATMMAEKQYDLAKQDMILRVTQAYFDVLLAQENLQTAQAQKASITEQLAAAKRNFDVGTATITDTHETQARFDLTTAQEIAAENDLLIKRQSLSVLTGKDPGELKRLKNDVQIGQPQPDDASKWSESAEKGNLNVLLSQTNVEIARREHEKQRAGHLPTVDLIATRGGSSTGNSLIPPLYSGTDTKSSTIGVQLTIPIFTGGLTVSRDRETLALREKAEAELNNARRTAALTARQAYLGVTSGLAQIKALEQAVTSSQSSLESNKLGYEVGERINIDVLNAQQQLHSTRRDLAKARLETLAAQLRLKSVAGSLNQEDVAQINGMLE